MLELQAEADRLREHAARQNAIVLSLKKRIQVAACLILLLPDLPSRPN